MAYLAIDTRADRIVWQLNRPERGNGLGTSLATELTAACEALRAGPPRPLVVTAMPLVKDGRATWIAGGDLKELAQLADRDAGAAYAAALGQVCATLAELPSPVIAAIDGAAIGGGAELALWCDERLMTARSSLEFRQLKVGLSFGYGSCKRLCDLVGLAKAQRLAFGCETLSAHAAQELGLCAEVVRDPESLPLAIDAAVGRWMAMAPEAVAAQKAMFWHATNSHPGASRAAELEQFRGAWGNPQHRDVLDRFRS